MPSGWFEAVRVLEHPQRFGSVARAGILDHMGESITYFVSSALLLFLVMDPLGNIPLFLAATKYVPAKRRQHVIARELLIALVIMVLFFFLGSWFLNMLHITEPALAVGGGLILMFIAVKMVFPSSSGSINEGVAGEPFIVPLAVPYVAGPSVLATEGILVHQSQGQWPILLGALGAAWLVGSVILYLAGMLERVLGEKALTAIERLMGMVLVLISAQMLLDGIATFFHIG